MKLPYRFGEWGQFSQNAAGQKVRLSVKRRAFKAVVMAF